MNDSGRDFEETLDNEWITDIYIAKHLKETIDTATKTISTKDEWVIEVPDYNVRLSALKLAMQSKQLLKEKAEKPKSLKWIYVLVK